jgi:hypothetical protein
MSLGGRKGEPPADRPANVSVFERLRADFGIGPCREHRGCEPARQPPSDVRAFIVSPLRAGRPGPVGLEYSIWRGLRTAIIAG